MERRLDIKEGKGDKVNSGMPKFVESQVSPLIFLRALSSFPERDPAVALQPEMSLAPGPFFYLTSFP